MTQQRINELAIQSGGIWRGGYVEQANGDSVYTDKKFVSGGDMDVEQFARLIVRECAQVAKLTEEDDGDDYKSGRQWAGIDVLKHFGVEE